MNEETPFSEVEWRTMGKTVMHNFPGFSLFIALYTEAGILQTDQIKMKEQINNKKRQFENQEGYDDRKIALIQTL